MRVTKETEITSVSKMRITEGWEHVGWRHAYLFLLFPQQLCRAAGLERWYRARWVFGLACMAAFCSRSSKICICCQWFLQVLPSHGNSHKTFVSKSPKTLSRSGLKFSPGMQPMSGQWTVVMAQEQPLALRDSALLLSVQYSGIRACITGLYWNTWKQISIDPYEYWSSPSYRNYSLLNQWLC